MSSSIKRETPNLALAQAADVSRPLGSDSEADERASHLARARINDPSVDQGSLSAPSIAPINEQDSRLLRLPNDLFAYMFQSRYLNIEELGVLRQSCSQLNTLFQDEILFRGFIRREFKDREIPLPSNTNAQETYKNLRLFSTNLANGVYASHYLGDRKWVVSSLAIADGKIFSGFGDGDIKIWDLKTGECLRSRKEHERRVTSLVITDEKIISSSEWDWTIKICDLKTGEYLHTLAGHHSDIYCLASANGKILSGSKDYTIKIWDLETGKCLHTLDVDSWVSCLTVADGKIISGLLNGRIKIWDLVTGERLNTLKGRHSDWIGCLASTEGKIISGSCDHTIKIWDLETGNCLNTLEGHKDRVRSIAIADGKIFSSSDDCTIKIWDLKTGKCLHTLQDFRKNNISTLAIADGKIITNESGIKIMDFIADDKEKKDEQSIFSSLRLQMERLLQVMAALKSWIL